MAAKKKAAPKAKAAPSIVMKQDTPPPTTIKAVEPVAEKPVKAPKEPKAPKPVVFQRDKAPHANSYTVAELFKQIEEALVASEGQRQSRPLRWALKSLAMAEETAARHFSLL